MLPLLLTCALLEGHASEPAITSADLALRIQTLASDEFEGRAPNSKGEEMTVGYLVRELEAAGLTPGNNGQWVQKVPLVSTRPNAAPTTRLTVKDKEAELIFGRDLMVVSPRADAQVAVRDSQLVFCGFGVTAPEFEWNDFAGQDLKGKIVVCLVNDPGFYAKDPAVFKGNAMTYYGRYTYKFEEARRQGAAGCLVVHEESAAGYPWQVVNQGWGGVQHGLGAADDRPDVEGWITRDAIKRLVTEAGHDYDALEEAAKKNTFRSVPLDAKLSVALTNVSTRSQSNNVVAQVVGSERPDEYVMMCAHWDHLGKKEGLRNDPIYNGAHDNASGSGGLLELAQAFAAMDPPPKRSMLFLWVTAEESGLLGSKYYAANPIVPHAKTVAGLNMDGLNLHGPMSDIEVVGFGSSELEELLAQAAAAQGRTVSQEATPEKGYYYRSDHFSFAKHGVPMLYAGGGQVSREHGRDWVTAQNEAYTKKHYHQPSDEWDPSWDLSGAVEDLRIYYSLGRRLANSDEWPNWHADNEFRAIRDASRKN